MRTLALVLLVGVAACAHDPAARAAPPAATAAINAAVADSARPQADKDLDPERKPAEMLAFADVKPGEKIGELIPGGGYFSRIFSKAVGPTGKVYAISSEKQLGRFKAISDDKANYPNVGVIDVNGDKFTSPEPLDMIWTSQNYHDLKNIPAPFDINAYNASVYRALKPGGLYIVLDHAAKEDAPADVTGTLHRIQQSVVKKEVLAAGFEYVGESNAVRNPDDPRDQKVFDPSIRHKTDQFVMKFRKPK